MKQFLTVMVASLLAFAHVLASGQPGPADREISFTHDGRPRSCVVHIPPGYDPGKPLPLVLVLHGGAGNARRIEAGSGMSAKSDREGFIAAYPNGTGRFENLYTWNAGNCCGYALREQVDDVSFINALITRMEQRFTVDPKRIYVTGISNGGMMAYRLACELSERVAAVAPVAGAMNVACKPASPVSVMVFHGTADAHVLYEGGKPKRTLDYAVRSDTATPEAVAFWARRDGCDPEARQERKGNVVHEWYAGCLAGTGVELYRVEGGGHVWPGGKRGFMEIAEPAHEISATDLMWEFFKRHSKP